MLLLNYSSLFVLYNYIVKHSICFWQTLTRLSLILKTQQKIFIIIVF